MLLGVTDPTSLRSATLDRHPSARGGGERDDVLKENPQAMVFDTGSQSVPLKDDKLVSLLPPAGGPGAAPGGRGRGGAG